MKMLFAGIVVCGLFLVNEEKAHDKTKELMKAKEAETEFLRRKLFVAESACF